MATSFPFSDHGMRQLRMALVACAGCMVQPLHADFLDDAKVKPEDFGRSFNYPSFESLDVGIMQGIPLSPENRKSFVEALDPKPRAMFFEGQGMFAEALELVKEPSIDRARLLLRAGRKDEAREVLKAVNFPALLGLEGRGAVVVVRGACKPLEDTESWDLLAGFLQLLSESHDNPDWQVAIWAEELDIAWHREQEFELMVKAKAGDPIRHAALLNFLGRTAERDEVLANVLPQAGVKQAAAALVMFPDSPHAKRAAFRLWSSPDRSADERRVLWPALDRQRTDPAAALMVLGWLVAGGDATPLLDLMWQSWFFMPSPLAERVDTLALLHRRYPDDPRFAFLLARELHASDPARAVELYESAARQPFLVAADPDPQRWPITDLMVSTQPEVMGDVPFLAISGLGILNRQDRVQAVIESQPGFSKLPGADQARYLAAARMDRELFALADKLDFSQASNDGLAMWLARTWETRAQSRVIPRSVQEVMARRFADLATGSPEKLPWRVSSDAQALLRMLDLSEVDVGLLKAGAEKAYEIAKARNQNDGLNFGSSLRSFSNSTRRLKGILVEEPGARQVKVLPNVSVVTDPLKWKVALFAPPSIRRVGSVKASDRWDMRGGFPRPGRAGGYPIELLSRWTFASDPLLRPGLSQHGPQAAVMSGLLRSFPAGHPRRLPVELMIASQIVDTGDEALKKEATASTAALLAGEKEKRGTELFRYMCAASQGKDDATLRAILDEVKIQPPSLARAFMEKLVSVTPPTGQAMRLAVEAFGDPRIKPRPQPMREDEDTRKIRALQNEHYKMPESIELAKRILAKVDLLSPGGLSFEDRKALLILRHSGGLDEWLAETRKRLEDSGTLEVEILRAIERLDVDLSDESVNAKKLEYARKVLAALPTDRAALQTLMKHYIGKGDSEQVLASAQALGSYGVPLLISDESLATLGKKRAATVLEILRDTSPAQNSMSKDRAAALHAFFVGADPGLAESFRRWLSNKEGGLSGLRLRLGQQLLDAGRKEEAVELIARSYFVPQGYPGAPWAFPPGKPAGGVAFLTNGVDDELPALVKLLTERGVLSEVLAKLDEPGGGGVDGMGLYLAASPSPETFEKRVRPFLDKLDPEARWRVIHLWSEFFATKLGGTGPLMLVLLKERVKDDPIGVERFSRCIGAAATIAGSGPLIGEIWQELSREIAAADDKTRERALRAGRSVLPHMLFSADDETWVNYWKWRNSDEQPLGQLGYLPIGGPNLAPVPASRIRDVLPRALRESGMNGDSAKGWVGAAIASGSEELIGQVKGMLPEGSKELNGLCDLALGKPDAISTVLGAMPVENGETLIWWNLVSVDPSDTASGGRDIPRAAFPKLDGKFEIQITGGSDPDRLSVLETLKSVPVSGHAVRKLPPDTGYLALLTKQQEGGILRWTPPLALAGGSGPLLAAPLLDLEAKGFVKATEPGPGGLPAWRIRFSGRDSIDLMEIPFSGPEPLAFGAWVAGDGALALRFLDREGKELLQEELAAWDVFLPVWQYQSFSRTDREAIPGNTARIVLSAKVYGFNDGPLEFLVSGPRLQVGSVPPWPEGFEKVARIPSGNEMVTLSPDGGKLAAATGDGRVSVVDLTSGEARTIALAGLVDSGTESHVGVSALLWSPSGIFARDNLRTVHRVDPVTLVSEPIIRLGAIPPSVSPGPILSTTDGKWLVLRDGPELVLIDTTAGNAVRRIDVGGNFQMMMSDEGLRLVVNNEKRLLLKTGDFAGGQPVEGGVVEGEGNRLFPERSIDAKIERSIWKDRLAFQVGPTRVKDGERSRVEVPVSQGHLDISADGTLVYVDQWGTVVRVKP